MCHSKKKKEKRKRRRIRLFIDLVILVCLAYIWVGSMDYLFPPKVSNAYKESFNPDEFYSDEVGVDRAMIIDDATDRLNQILRTVEDAEETLDISYFFIKDSDTTDRILGAVLEAADRGVKVRIIVDGIKCGFTGEMGYALGNHENIEIAFYNPIDLTKPRLLHSRLHDKYVISDQKILLMGGGNLDDVYLNSDGRNGEKVDDRMVLVYNTAWESDNKESVLFDVKEYMNEMWDSEYVQIEYEEERDTTESVEHYCSAFDEWKSTYEEELNPEYYDYFTQTVSTDQITFFHNEIYTGVKEPTAEYVMTQLMGNANERVVMETPYLIADDEIYGLLNDLRGKDVQTDVLLSSAANVPFVDLFLFTTYSADKRNLVATGANLYEYQDREYKHSKTYIIDDSMTLIGSYNLCFHSYVYNTDVMLAIDSKEFAALTLESSEGYLQNSCIVGEDGNYEPSSVTEQPVAEYKEIFIMIMKYPLALFRGVF